MKNLIKSVIKFLTLIFISFTVNAANVLGSSWLNSEDMPNAAVSALYNDKGGTMLFIVNEEPFGHVQFIIQFYTNNNAGNCRHYGAGKTKTLNDNYIFNVEGQDIRMRITCFSGREYWQPVTKQGNDFIINKFKRLNYVNLDGLLWNAKGFTKEYNRIVRASKAL